MSADLPTAPCPRCEDADADGSPDECPDPLCFQGQIPAEIAEWRTLKAAMLAGELTHAGCYYIVEEAARRSDR